MSVLSRRASSSSDTSTSSDTISYESKPTRRNPNKTSTFPKKPFKERSYAEMLCSLALADPKVHELVPMTFDRGPVPSRSSIPDNIFVLASCAVPIGIQSIAFSLGYETPVAVAFPLYFFCFVGYAIAMIGRLNGLMMKYGCLAEKYFPRDEIPDAAAGQLATGILAYFFVRLAFAFFLHYDKSINPLTAFEWHFPVRLVLWELTFDYFFYVYHRSTHQVASLWKIHKHHHSTRHPIPILSILADSFQEFLEVFTIPLLASLLVPMSFHELYIVLSYTILVETLGHSGIRAKIMHPILGPLLEPIGMELEISDHELHHSSPALKNLGKQSRVWDWCFGTMGDRTETL